MAERSDEIRTGDLVFFPGTQRSEGMSAWASRPSPVLARYRRIAKAMVLTDAMALMITSAGVYTLSPHADDRVVATATLGLLYVVTQLAAFASFHLYAPQRTPPSAELRSLLLAMTVGVSAVAMLSFWSKATVSRFWIAGTWALGLLLTGAVRLAWRTRVARGQRSGELSLRTVVIGTNDEARRLARAMRARPAEGFEPIGFLSTDRHVVEFDGLPVLGPLGSAAHAIQATEADCVFVASSAVGADEVSWLARVLRPQDVEVRFSTNLPELLISRLALQPIAKVPSLLVRRARLTGTQAALKRTTDVTMSALLLLLAAPLGAVITLAVKLTSPGPVFFRQERIGMRGRPFDMLKFRTMVVDAEERLAEVRHLNDAAGPLFKIRDDPRVTRVGRFLRRHSLDELPQLLSVLRGDMSLVGPRPPLREEVSAYERWHFARLEVRPGMTGLGQVTGRSDRSFEDTVRLDVFYIENWSFSYDLFILAKTIPAVFHGRGAY